ncbi:MAG: hypothetical protein ABUS49_00415 [Acidobacteriota bacterium]
MTRHLSETELALLAGGDCNAVSRFFLDRHLRQCSSCLDRVTEFAILREDIAAAPLENVDWEQLSAEMTANIHLGLEAGQCVRRTARESVWNPKLAVAFASLAILLGAGFLMRAPHAAAPSQTAGSSILEATGSGVQLRTGASSLTLMNHHGAVTDQTVSAQGEIRASYIDSGAVTFNVVYLE